MFRKKKTKKPALDIPRDLTELGYYIDADGKLKTIKDDQPYVFEVKDKAYNEALYEVIVGILGEWIEDKFLNEIGMTRLLLPLGATENDIHTKVYVTPDYQSNEKVMVFIPGTSHTVGIWSRRALFDKSVVEGSMITYIKRAISLGFAVVICNPNEVFWYKGKGVLILPKVNAEFDSIPGNESPESHTKYVFKNIILPSAAQKIFIVANSYGGHCAVDAVQTHFDELKDRLSAIEFTASTHSIDFVKSDRLKIWIRENCRNWLMSDLEVGKEILDTRFGCICLSADSEFNEYVTTSVIDQVFDFFVKKLNTPDNLHETMMAEEYDEENILDQLDQKVQKLFADDSLVNDVQDRIQFGDYSDYPIYPLSEKGEGSSSGWD